LQFFGVTYATDKESLNKDIQQSFLTSGKGIVNRSNVQSIKFEILQSFPTRMTKIILSHSYSA